MLKCLIKRFAAGEFRRDETGSVSLEAIIMMPLVFWTYLAMFSFFDAYQEYNVNQKAAYTISDMISRETLPLDAAYLDGVQELLDYLTHSTTDAKVRVTSLRYNKDDLRFYVHWSRARGGQQPVTDSEVAAWTSRIPELTDGEYIVITETWTDYTTPFSVGLPDQLIENFVFTRPRYAPRVLYQGTT